ncbi:MAG: hypothetical protein R3F25_12125 [Gammaproteobacteria bacterium]|nr:hypothetical protein [Xanthomonadales bacterium]
MPIPVSQKEVIKQNNDVTREHIQQRLNKLTHHKSDNYSNLYFPDLNFRSCIQKLKRYKPEQIQHLDCSNQNIKDITGINHLSNLISLDLSGNQIESIHLSGNQILQTVNISQNKLKNLSGLPKTLVELNANNNKLEYLKIEETPELRKLQIANNFLIDFSIDAPNLELLDIRNNQLLKVELKNQKSLKTLLLADNQLSLFKIDGFQNIKYIDLRNNHINRFENSFIEHYFTLFMDGNGKFSDNGQFKLTFPKAHIITQDLPGKDFPDSVLRDCIALHLETTIDKIQSINCYEASQIINGGNKIQDTTGLEHLVSLRYLIMDNQDISSIDLKPFDKLENINLSNNKLSTIDIANNFQLTNADFSNNLIENFSTENLQLRRLNLSHNKLNEINLDGVQNLRDLNLSHNDLQQVDISSLVKLRSLNIENNKLKDIELENIPYLKGVKLNNNPWSEAAYRYFQQRFYNTSKSRNDSMFKGQISIPKVFAAAENTFPDPGFRRCVTKHVNDAIENSVNVIIHLSCQGRAIKDITGIETMPQLEAISLTSSYINELDLSIYKKLVSLRLRETKIKHLDLSGNPLLKSLELQSNQIESITFNKNQDIIYMDVSNNNLKELNLHSMSSLEKLFAHNNQLKIFSHAEYPNMTLLKLSNNQLSRLNTNSFKSVKYLYLDNNQFTHIDLIPLTQLETLIINNNLLNQLDLSTAIKLNGVYIYDNPLPKLDLTHGNFESVRVDLLQYGYLKQTHQLEIFDYEENIEKGRYKFLKKKVY